MSIADEFISRYNPLYQAAKAGRFLAPQAQEEPASPQPIADPSLPPQPPAPSVRERVGNTAISGIGAAGHAFDLPRSVVTDLLTWLPGGLKPHNPFDQLLDPFGKHAETNRIDGNRRLAQSYGLMGKKDTWGNFAVGLAADMALDPTTYFGMPGMNKIAKANCRRGSSTHTASW